MIRRVFLAILTVLFLVSVAPTGAGETLPDQDCIVAGEGVSLNASNGPNVTLGEKTEFCNSNPYTDSNTITLEPWGSAESSGPTAVTVDEWNGTWTNLSSMSVESHNLTFRPNDKPNITAGGNISLIRYKDPVVDDGSVDVIYNGNGGTLTLRGLPANTQIALGSKDGNLGDIATSDGSGTATFELDDVPSTTEAYLFTNFHDPTIDNSTASPTDSSEAVESLPVTLSVDVSDADFATNGDRLNAEFTYDGSVVGEDQLSSNGTADYTLQNAPSGGSHTWSVTVTDQYGQTVSSQEFSFLAPSEVTIRNVSNTDEIIKGPNITLEASLFSGELAFERTVTNGTVNLSGIPTGRGYILTVNADDYHQRTIILPNLYEQRSVYLLNKKYTSVFNAMELNDLSGSFPSGESKLILERPVKRDGNTTWTIIAGDYFGADNRFAIDLKQDTRYRVRVRNEDKDERIIGSYVASTGGVVSLDIGEVRWSVEDPESLTWSSQTYNLTESNPNPFGYVQFKLNAPNGTVSDIHLRIYEQGNQDNVIYNQTHNGPYGTFVLNQSISGNQVTNKTWVVNWSAKNNGEIIGGSRAVSSAQYPVNNPFSKTWTPFFVGGILLFTALIFGGSHANIGALLTAGVAAVLWYIGWHEASGGIVVLGLIAAILASIGGGSGQGVR